MTTHEEIRQYLYNRKGEIIESLLRLAEIPSFREEAIPGAPFGFACRTVLEETQALHARYGFTDSMLSDDGYLLTTVGEGEHTVGLFAHGDVVTPGDGWTLTEPFSPIEKDGCLIGRGVNDNKSGITASLFAVRALQELHYPLSSRIVLFTGANEESGMEDIASFVKHHPMPDVSLVPDAAFPVYRGEKGILRFKAVSRRKAENIVDLHGGQAFNIVLGKVSLTIPVNGVPYDRLNDDKRVKVTKNDSEMTIEAIGISKHAALPEDSVNAVVVLNQVLKEYRLSLGEDGKDINFMANLIEDYYGNAIDDFSAQKEVSGRNTIVNGIIEIKGGHLCFGFDVRFVNEKSDDLIDCIRNKLSKGGFDMEILYNSPGFLISEENPQLNRLLQVYSDCTGQNDPQSKFNAGGTYSRYLKNSFSVGSCLGNPRSFELPMGHGGVHQPDEYLNINAHLEAIAILAEMILALDEEICLLKSC